MEKNENNKIHQCDKCGRSFERKWVPARKRLSKINDVSYWTDEKGWENYKLVCRTCLKGWFDNERTLFIKLVSPKKKRIFYNYYYSGKFNQEEEGYFNKYKQKI
ncbi:MAG: hypothetical protein mread185_000655 [Mycoplasmataceae bacterium]|nr:MAG: hypothetical protein mread185_000655 [Mycoplasmataceae bacterium]